MQFYALSVLDLLDRIRDINNDDRELRLAMVTAHLADLDAAFPELGLNVETDDEAEIPDDEAQVTYDFSNATYDPKAVEEEIREMLARAASDRVSFNEPTYTDWV